MKKMLLSLLFLPAIASAQTADQIIEKVDEHQEFVTQKFSASMEIIKGKRKLVKKFNGYSQKKGWMSFMTFTNTEDKGVKYLKIDKELWIYFPDADSIMKISGHMLRQGMMGSDISYEDMLESDNFKKKYSSALLNNIAVDGKDCYVIELTAKVPNAAYARQVLYVDKILYAPVKMERYAKGGRLLKELTLHDFKTIQGRVVPMKIIFRDKRKNDSETIMTFENVVFDSALPENIFTKRSLRRE